MKNPIILVVLIICFFCFQSYSQEQVSANKLKSDFWKHVQFGGGISLSFGNDFFSGTLAPSAIYRFNEIFATGIGINTTYNK